MSDKKNTNDAPDRQQNANDGRQQPSPRQRPDGDLDTAVTGLADQYRGLGNRIAGSLREQSETFATMVETAQRALEERSALREERAALQASVNHLNEQLHGARQAREASQREIKGLRTANEGLEAQRAELVSTCQHLEERLKAAEQLHGELKSMNLTLEQDLAKVSGSNEELKSLVQQSEDARRELQAAKKAVDQQLAELKSVARRLEARAESAESANQELQATRQTLQSELSEVTAACQSATTRLESAERANEELEQMGALLEEENAAHRSRVSELEGQLEGAAREREQVRAINASLNEEIANLKAEHDALREHAEAADQEQSKLQATRQTLESCLAELSVKAQELESGRRGPELNRAAEKELATLRARVAELEAAAQERDALRQRVSQLEPLEAETPAAQDRIEELEAALRDARDRAARAGATGAITDELASRSSRVQRLAHALGQMKLDPKYREPLLGAATDLAVHLDLLAAAAELGRPDTTIDLRSDTVSLIDTIQETAQKLACTAADKGMTLHSRLDPALPNKLWVDGKRLRQLLEWAVAFVTRHAVEGDVTLLVNAEGEGAQKDYIEFCVHNNGMGLSSEQLARIVGPPAGGATRRGDEVDLFAVLAEAMGGGLRVENAGKQGFAVRFAIAIRHAATDRRQDERVVQELLQCNLGPVIDLSSNGVRVLSQKPLKGRVLVEIPTPMHHLKLPAMVIWTNRLERRRFEIGLQFIELLPAQVEQLLGVAQHHSLRAAG